MFYELYEDQVIMVLDSGAFYSEHKGLALYHSHNDLTAVFRDDTSYYNVGAYFNSVLQWHHLVITWGNATEIEFYINGCPAGFDPTITHRTTEITTAVDFRIGGNIWGGATERGVLAVDHFLVWYNVMTPEQVWQLYVQGGQM